MLSTTEPNNSNKINSLTTTASFTTIENNGLISQNTNNSNTNITNLVPTLENAVNNSTLNSNNPINETDLNQLNKKINLSITNNLLNNKINSLHNNNLINSNITSNLISVTNEQPSHYNYLKEFRVEQCPLFVQHKCTQHKPFTCFNWHFQNQKRRRPLRKKDGTFNYSPDNYCSKYDETTGICADGEECVLLHRTAGDTERRYHLRYYKTGNCVYETDSRGFCVKNGPHCAFAHGSSDLRNPIYDIHETTLNTSGYEDQENNLNMVNGSFTNSLDKDRNVQNDDIKWQDTSFVLSNYKTEFCKKPPRLCRQGYACPQFHNTKDRRRSPKIYKYRSTPCPSVKQSDEWGDPVHCEAGDNCHYCHTRTEQQFHPEIYKSTKCNDIQQTSYCPRGPFCAFAHKEQEMNAERELSLNTCSDLNNLFSNSASNDKTGPLDTSNNSNNSNNGISITSRGTNFGNSNSQLNQISQLASSNSINIVASSSNSNANNSFMPSSVPSHFGFPEFVGLNSQSLAFQRENTPPMINNTNNVNNTLGPIARPRSYSSSHTSNLHQTLNSINRENLLNSFFKMGNSIDEKTSTLSTLSNQKQQQSIQPIRKVSTPGSFFSNNTRTDSPCGLFSNQQFNSTLQSNLINNTSCNNNNSLGTNLKNGPGSNFFSRNLDTVESVVESALDDLTLDELGSIEKDLVNRNLSSNTLQDEQRNLSGNSSTGVGRSPNNLLTGTTAPVNIPGANQRSDMTNISSPPVGFGQSPFSRKSLNQNISSSVGSSLYDFSTHSNISPTNQQQLNILQQQQQSQAMLIEIQRLREELAITKNKGIKAEEHLQMVRQECEFWKSEAEKAHLEKKGFERRPRKD